MTDVEQSPTLLDRMGGMSGLAAAGVLSLAFVIANAIAGSRTGSMTQVRSGGWHSRGSPWATRCWR